jgi:hypothetical protein
LENAGNRGFGADSIFITLIADQMRKMSKNSTRLTAALFLLITTGICMVVTLTFEKMYQVDELRPASGLSETKRLSDYAPQLAGTNGDSEIYIFRGTEPGGSALILGGTHADEAAGFMTAYLLLENISVEQGTVFILPRANNSGFTHNLPQEGSPQYFEITGKTGSRKFRYGSRLTNPVDQWPDPEIYFHFPSGQKLAGNETRNLNRAYPGRPDGTLTEQIAFAVIQLINTEKIDLSFDLHEASPEYPVVNAIVAPERSQDIATEAAMELEFEDLRYSLESSPYNFRGLSHREWELFTDTMPFLFETANPIQGRLRGKTDARLLLTGQDKMYLRAVDLKALKVPYDSTGIPLKLRVARHLAALDKIISVYSLYNEKSGVRYSGIPTYEELITDGLEQYF